MPVERAQEARGLAHATEANTSQHADEEHIAVAFSCLSWHVTQTLQTTAASNGYGHIGHVMPTLPTTKQKNNESTFSRNWNTHGVKCV